MQTIGMGIEVTAVLLPFEIDEDSIPDAAHDFAQRHRAEFAQSRTNPND
jgi:hypothetical protein